MNIFSTQTNISSPSHPPTAGRMHSSPFPFLEELEHPTYQFKSIALYTIREMMKKAEDNTCGLPEDVKSDWRVFHLSSPYQHKSSKGSVTLSTSLPRAGLNNHQLYWFDTCKLRAELLYALISYQYHLFTT